MNGHELARGAMEQDKRGCLGCLVILGGILFVVVPLYLKFLVWVTL